MEIENKKYKIVETRKHNKYLTTYVLEDEEGILYRLFVEDYREAHFILYKFYKAVISPFGNPMLKSVNINNIKWK